jgi:hypothetical protein
MRIFVLTAFLLYAFATHAAGVTDARKEHEKREVQRIFEVLLSQMRPGDGRPWDVECVFDEKWLEDDGKALLTAREALDPKRQHPKKFCDRDERDKMASAAAQRLEGSNSWKRISVANMDFNYPKFNKALTRATVRHVGMNYSFFKGDKKDMPVGSIHSIYLRKKKLKWTMRIETDGIIN